MGNMMDGMQQLLQYATSLAFVLPNIVACTVGAILLSNSARPGAARSRGFTGIALLAVAIVMHLALDIWRFVLLSHAGDYSRIEVQFRWLSAGSFVAVCVGAAGLLVVIMALCQATRDAQPAQSS